MSRMNFVRNHIGFLFLTNAKLGANETDTNETK